MKKGEKLNQLSVVTMQRMIGEKDHRIAVLERALKLACSKIGIVPIITDENVDAFYRKHKEATMDDYFIDQAENDVEE